jgi:hypothetical protein
MGREIRRVPPDWDHPRSLRPAWEPGIGATEKMACTPMLDESLREAQEEWDEGKRKWDAGDNELARTVWTEVDLRREEARAAELYSGKSARDDAEFVREHLGQLVYESYEEYAGERPKPEDAALYRPDWPEESRTAFQVYETVSEGTPVSPVFETREELLAWLSDPSRDARLLPHMSREAAERFVTYGSVPSLMIKDGQVASSVEMLEPSFRDS